MQVVSEIISTHTVPNGRNRKAIFTKQLLFLKTKKPNGIHYSFHMAWNKKVLAIFIGKPCIRSMSEVRLVANSAKYFFRRLTFMRLDDLTVIYLFKSLQQWGEKIYIFCIIVFNFNNSID